MIEAFRIEHPDTLVGPFQTPDEFTQDLARKAANRRGLREPYMDGLGLAWLPHFYVFGSPSLETLKMWFFFGSTLRQNEAIVQELKTRGFKLAEFLVDEENYKLGISKNQLAFDADTCRQDGLVVYHELDKLLQSSPLVFDIY